MSTQTKVPYSRYLQVLCLTNVPDDTVTESFYRRSLKPPESTTIKSVRTNLFSRMSADVQSFYVSQEGIIDVTKLTPEVVAFFNSMGFSDILKNQEGFSAAKICFDNVDLRVCLYSHIINNEPEDEIRRVIQKMTKYKPHPDLIPFFKKYFCDMIYMDYISWKEWIVELRDINAFEYDIYRACFDSRFPFDLIRWKIHAELSTQDADELLKQLVTFTYYKTLETMETASDADYEMVHSWIEKFLRTYEKHKVLGKGRAGGDGNVSLTDDAVFELKRVRQKMRNVTELGENAPKIAAPIIIEIPKQGMD